MKILSVEAGFKPAPTIDRSLPRTFVRFFLYFSDGTDFAYIGGDILCLFDCSFFKYLFNIDIDSCISEFFAEV